MRSNHRGADALRPVSFETGFTQNADGSVLVSFGDTKVICTAFLEERVPQFIKHQNLESGRKRGWATGEYGMLPGSTHSRTDREAARGRQSGRTIEISRLIGRALRTCFDFDLLEDRTVKVDCDVIQADGGTRTASITGGATALSLCLWKHREKFLDRPIVRRVAAVSLGIVKGQVLVDLDYREDSNAEVDLNLVMDHRRSFVEIQGAAERDPFTHEQLSEFLAYGEAAIASLLDQQKAALVNAGVDPSWIP